MRLGLMLGYAGRQIELPMEMIKEADRLGVYVLWTAEAYGSDAVSPLAWIGAQTENIKLGTAIMQMPGRSPANTAMTALDVAVTVFHPTKMTTPINPRQNPRSCDRVKCSFNHTKATNVPKRGAVAFNMAVNPAGKDRDANA